MNEPSPIDRVSRKQPCALCAASHRIIRIRRERRAPSWAPRTGSAVCGPSFGCFPPRSSSLVVLSRRVPLRIPARSGCSSHGPKAGERKLSLAVRPHLASDRFDRKAIDWTRRGSALRGVFDRAKGRSGFRRSAVTDGPQAIQAQATHLPRPPRSARFTRWPSSSTIIRIGRC